MRLKLFFWMLGGWLLCSGCTPAFRTLSYLQPPRQSLQQLTLALEGVVLRPAESCFLLRFTNGRRRVVRLRRAALRLETRRWSYHPMSFAEVVHSREFQCQKNACLHPQRLDLERHLYPRSVLRLSPQSSHRFLICYRLRLRKKQRFNLRLLHGRNRSLTNRWPRFRFLNLPLPLKRKDT